MRVALLNDLPVSGATNSGFGSGAELTSGRFVKEGIQRGHEIDVICPEFFNPHTLDSYDLAVTKNLANFNPDQVKLIMQKKYVAWPSDYAWSRWRLFFAFQENHKRLANIPFWTEFFTKSALNVFLSPLHKEAYDFVLPKAAYHPHILSPPPIDTELFKPDPAGWEKDTACCINGLLQFKSIYANLRFAEEHPELKVTYLGSIRDPGVQIPKNATYAGPKPLKELAEILGRTEIYFEMSDTCQPANQTAFQGFLACKKVICTPLLGAASYDWFKRGDRKTGRRVLNEAMPNLWQTLEKEVAA